MSYRFLKPEEVQVGLECEEYIIDFSRYISFPGHEFYDMWFLGQVERPDPPDFKSIVMTEKDVAEYNFWIEKGFQHFRIKTDI